MKENISYKTVMHSILNASKIALNTEVFSQCRVKDRLQFCLASTIEIVYRILEIMTLQSHILTSFAVIFLTVAS